MKKCILWILFIVLSLTNCDKDESIDISNAELNDTLSILRIDTAYTKLVKEGQVSDLHNLDIKNMGFAIFDITDVYSSNGYVCLKSNNELSHLHFYDKWDNVIYWKTINDTAFFKMSEVVNFSKDYFYFRTMINFSIYRTDSVFMISESKVRYNESDSVTVLFDTTFFNTEKVDLEDSKLYNNFLIDKQTGNLTDLNNLRPVTDQSLNVVSKYYTEDINGLIFMKDDDGNVYEVNNILSENLSKKLVFSNNYIRSHNYVQKIESSDYYYFSYGLYLTVNNGTSVYSKDLSDTVRKLYDVSEYNLKGEAFIADEDCVYIVARVYEDNIYKSLLYKTNDNFTKVEFKHEIHNRKTSDDINISKFGNRIFLINQFIQEVDGDLIIGKIINSDTDKIYELYTNIGYDDFFVNWLDVDENYLYIFEGKRKLSCRLDINSLEFNEQLNRCYVEIKNSQVSSFYESMTTLHMQKGIWCFSNLNPITQQKELVVYRSEDNVIKTRQHDDIDNYNIFNIFDFNN
jgi:hypothetical protein